MPTPNAFNDRNEPPPFEPILACAAVFMIFVLLLIALLLAAS